MTFSPELVDRAANAAARPSGEGYLCPARVGLEGDLDPVFHHLAPYPEQSRYPNEDEGQQEDRAFPHQTGRPRLTAGLLGAWLEPHAIERGVQLVKPLLRSDRSFLHTEGSFESGHAPGKSFASDFRRPAQRPGSIEPAASLESADHAGAGGMPGGARRGPLRVGHDATSSDIGSNRVSGYLQVGKRIPLGDPYAGSPPPSRRVRRYTVGPARTANLGIRSSLTESVCARSHPPPRSVTTSP